MYHIIFMKKFYIFFLKKWIIISYVKNDFIIFVVNILLLSDLFFPSKFSKFDIVLNFFFLLLFFCFSYLQISFFCAVDLIFFYLVSPHHLSFFVKKKICLFIFFLLSLQNAITLIYVLVCCCT